MDNVIAWVHANCKFAAYSTDLGMLRDYLKHGIDPHDFPHLLEQYFEANGFDLPEGFESDYEQLDKMSESELQAFKGWLEKNNHLMHDAFEGAHSPSYLHLDYQKIVPPGTWLIHFSNNAADIGRKGFEYGHEDMYSLGLTTWFTDKARMREQGWNFAFEAGSNYAAQAAYKQKYGEHAVMFQCAGVNAFHSGDQEAQIIYQGKDARNIVTLMRNDSEWEVSAKNGRVIFKSEYENVVQWVISNYNQYKNVIR